MGIACAERPAGDKAGGAAFASGRAPSAFVRQFRPGRVTLDILLPENCGLRPGNLLRAGDIPLCGSGKAGKPLEIRELVRWLGTALKPARVVARRCVPRVPGDLVINIESRLLSFGNTLISDLTGREFDLFSSLVANSPKIFSRREIISDIWKTAAVDNLVDTHIYNIRRKLPARLAARIRSVPGRGFRYLK